MVEVYIIEPNGGKKALGGVLGFTLNRELGAADDLTVKLCDCEAGNMKATRIELMIDGCIEFSGIIDEAVTYENSGGRAAVIYARSAAGILLDNEAKPMDYKNADSALIAKNHIEPFGLECVCEDNGEYTDMSIYKGVSHWQVIKSFCRRCYDSEPYVNGEGRVVLYERDSSDELCFDNGGGIEYSSAVVDKKYFRLISSVYTKAAGREEYDIEDANELAEEYGITRRRYVDGESLGCDYGRQMIDSGNAESLDVRISTPCFIRCPLKRKCSVRLNSGEKLWGLRCVKVKLSLGKQGFETVVTMTGKIGGR